MVGWTRDKLRNILELIYGNSLPKDKRKNGDIPVYGSNGIVGYHNEALVDQEGIIVGRKGSAGNVHLSKIPFFPIDTTFYISKESTQLDLDFLFYALLKLDLKRILGDVGVPGLNREMAYLEELKFPINLNEQRKIAHVLKTIQRAIEQQDKLIRTTTELKKALMQKLFSEGTRGENQKQAEIGWVPESWEEIVLGDLGKCVTGTTPKTGIDEYWNSNDYDFIAPADIGNNKFVYNSAKKMSEAGLKVSRVLPKYSVLCVCIGSSIGKVGMSFKELSATNQQINSIICNERYNSVYTYYLLSYYADHWRSYATFGPVPILNKGQFEIIKIYASQDLIEQGFIADSLSTLDSKIEFHNKKKQTLADLFKTLLHELMTGQRRVNDIDFDGMNKEYKFEEHLLNIAAED